MPWFEPLELAVNLVREVGHGVAAKSATPTPTLALEAHMHTPVREGAQVRRAEQHERPSARYEGECDVWRHL